MKEIKNNIHKIIKYLEWLYNYTNRKYSFLLYLITKYLRNIVTFSMISLGVVGMLYFCNVIVITLKPLKISINNNLSINESVIQQLVIAQISATFLITALLSLVANLENKYIYGEKAIGNIFTGKYVTFTKVFYFLILLMFSNIAMIVNKYSYTIAFCIVIVSLLILVWLIFCILKLFLQTNSIKKDLIVKYYRENIKVLTKSQPLRNYNSSKLINLRERYIYLIVKGDIEYVEFYSVYINLIDKTLFNHKEKLQEYYTEAISYDDLIANYVFIIENLIACNKIDRGLDYYSKLLERLNYFNTYIPYYDLFAIFERINDYIYTIKNKVELKELVRKCIYISNKILEQAYLCSISDFSFTRLGKLNDELYIKNCIKSNIYELIYDSIYTNKNIDYKDKKEIFIMLFDGFRMSSHYIRYKIHDITTFHWKRGILPDREVDVHILGFLVSRLLLRTLYNNDERNFKLFLQMNIKKDEMLFVKHVILLTIVKMNIENLNNNIYSEYDGLDTEETLKLIKSSKSFFKEWDDLEAQVRIYCSIKKNCIDNKKFNTGGYFKDYFLEYKQNFLDSYFSIIFDFLNFPKSKEFEIYSDLELEKIKRILRPLFR